MISFSSALTSAKRFGRKENWRRRDLNPQPSDLIHDELDHRTTVSCKAIDAMLADEKSFSIQINKNLFAEVRGEEKGNTLTHRINQSISSRRRRGDKKRKKWRHHLKHQSYVVAPSASICVTLTKLLLRNIDHRW